MNTTKLFVPEFVWITKTLSPIERTMPMPRRYEEERIKVTLRVLVLISVHMAARKNQNIWPKFQRSSVKRV